MKKLICRIFGHNYKYMGTEYKFTNAVQVKEIISGIRGSYVDLDHITNPQLEITCVRYKCIRCDEEIDFLP